MRRVGGPRAQRPGAERRVVHHVAERRGLEGEELVRHHRAHGAEGLLVEAEQRHHVRRRLVVDLQPDHGRIAGEARGHVARHGDEARAQGGARGGVAEEGVERSDGLVARRGVHPGRRRAQHRRRRLDGPERSAVAAQLLGVGVLVQIEEHADPRAGAVAHHLGHAVEVALVEAAVLGGLHAAPVERQAQRVEAELANLGRVAGVEGGERHQRRLRRVPHHVEDAQDPRVDAAERHHAPLGVDQASAARAQRAPREGGLGTRRLVRRRPGIVDHAGRERHGGGEGEGGGGEAHGAMVGGGPRRGQARAGRRDRYVTGKGPT